MVGQEDEGYHDQVGGLNVWTALAALCGWSGGPALGLIVCMRACVGWLLRTASWVS